MTMTLKIDLADGVGAKFARHGWEHDRIAIVSGITGAANAKLVNALGCPGLPLIGAPHPSLPYCYLEDITVSAITADAVKLRLHYANPSKRANAEAPTIEYHSSMSRQNVNVDKDGDLIVATYGGEEQGGTVSVPATEKDITYSRVETGDPRDKWQEYDGAVNSVEFLGKAARTWFLVINARSSNNGVTWEMTYQFFYNEDTWDGVIVYVDPATGRPPSDAVEEANRCVPEKDFNLLLLHL